MSSNGVWIANANNDTMLNGTGLNPGTFVNDWSNGLIIPYANVFLPFPGDSNKYVLVHHSAEFNGQYYPVLELMYSVVDLTLDNGLGEVVSKNNLMLSDTLNWGIGACKHANGRDWWMVVQKDMSDEIRMALLTPDGVFDYGSQHLGVVPSQGNVAQLTFSQDGTKFGYTSYSQNSIDSCFTFIADFDRCAGLFTNTRVFNFYPSGYLWGFSFSPNSNFAYANTSARIFQLNIDSMSIDTVALYDGFISGAPPNCCQTSFAFEYLAANGKIYITSGSSVQHIHEINYPDSAGLACDVQQHAISLGVWSFRAVPNHPNYNLGPVVGSLCDTLSVGIAEIKHDFKFSISPNPTSDGYIKLMYLLPQNKPGGFEVYDMTGQLVYKMNLPSWSTLQMVKLPELSNGVYTCVVRSGYEWVGRKLVVVR
ncbi:MAG: T9SS type A sorting domain-containing protein [Bacteroidetes bacterium]|nr:T9SS type A sorting domain-containing protein [Bacteroidota bacterium]